jgi:hypothetical protein
LHMGKRVGDEIQCGYRPAVIIVAGQPWCFQPAMAS